MLVPPSAPVEMARALATLLTNADTREEMGAAARARVEAEFSLDGMIRRYEAMYLQLARAADDVAPHAPDRPRVVGEPMLAQHQARGAAPHEGRQ